MRPAAQVRVTSQHGPNRVDHYEPAECRKYAPRDIDLIFFTPTNEPTAIAICNRCPVRELCLTAALDYEGTATIARRFGVFGGLTPYQRADLASRRTA